MASYQLVTLLHYTYMKVFIVTSTENGWDCVSGVFKEEKKAIDFILEMDQGLDKYGSGESTYIIHEKTIR